MFFRRNEGQYRETDRVTRFKLVKSGKHWLRAATSHFGLFKIISGRVDASSVSVHQVEEEVPLITSDRLLKGVAATGALLGGGVATYVVQADEATSPSAVEHTVSPTTDVLAASDSAVLGHSGAITESAVRLLTTRYLLGLFDGSEYDKIPYSVVECKEHIDEALKMARKSCVLLKNDGVLPIDKTKVNTIGVIGPNANSRAALIGNYHGTSSEYITVLEGIRNKIGNVIYENP